MKRLKFFFGALGILVLIYPAVSSSQISYVMNASVPYSYISVPPTNKITSWVGDADDGYFDLSLVSIGNFVFQFYGVPVTTLRITTNGYMTFGTEEGRCYDNYPIPYSPTPGKPNALIAPFWDDLDLSASLSAQVRWEIIGTPPYRQLVVEWFEVPSYNFGGAYSFEAILYESTNEIKFQYLNVASGTASDYGEFSTVGVENFDGTSGSEFSYNTPSLSNGLAIEFIPKLVTLFFDDFSTDKGWTGYEIGRWERGSTYAGIQESGNPDPGADHTAKGDNYVLGYAIGGNYPNNLPVKEIISPSIDCTGQDRVFLKFWRYLNVESNSYDHAKVHVSNDGINWTELWENPVFNITDNQWTQVVFDVSSIAANQRTVYIKFIMGPTNGTGRYSGWNIDDLEVTSDYAGSLALYIPSGNSPNPNIDEIMVENGLGIKHDTAIPNDLSDYNILIVSEEGACNPTTANYINIFLQGGGSAILMGGTPNALAGNTGDLSSISDWFGAGLYGNDCGYATIINNPIGANLSVNDSVDYSVTGSCLADSVYGENPETIIISTWATQGRTHSFIHSFGPGRVFYYSGNPGYSEDQNPITVGNGLILFEAGLLWAVADCPMPSITTQPQSQTIQSGQTATLSVAATDATPLSYQWYEGASGDTSNLISGATSSSYTTPVLTQTTSYWVRVNNSCGSYVDSDTAIITMAGSCTAPNITSQPQSQTIQSGQTATMSVGASGTAPFSYQWYRGSSGDTSNPINGATSSSYTTPALTQTTSYWVRVNNSCGSANSNTASITVNPATPPSPPTNVSASDGTYLDNVEVKWVASPGATSYTVCRATSLSRWVRKTVLGTTSGTFFNDTTAVPKITYYYWVKASNTYGTSIFSVYDAGYRSDGTPPAPTNVSASDGTYLDRVEVAWAAPSGATSYTVYRATSLSRWVRKTVLGTTSGISFSDTTAIPKRTYYYWIKASNTYGTSNFSSYDAGYRSDGTPPPPTNVSASDGTYLDRVEVTWAASSGATSYTVYRATSLSNWVTKTVLGTTSGTSFSDTTATPGRTYYYWIKAVNAYGASNFSAYDAGYR